MSTNPYARDPEMEKMDLPEEGSIDAIDVFNAPPPGHSLTDDPQKWRWEQPPEYTDPEEAMEWVVSRIEQPDVEENFSRLMLAGVPIEAITNTVAFTGFTEGYWTPDLAEIIKLPLVMHFVGLALEQGIPATIFNKDPNVTKEENLIPDEKVMTMMEENRPDMYNKVMYAIDLLLDEDMDEEDVETTPPVVEDASFMDMEEGEMV